MRARRQFAPETPEMVEATKKSAISTGGPLLGAAKLFFLVAAYATTLALTRLIDPAELGQYNVVARIIAVPNMVIIQTLMFAVSRPMAAQYEDGTPAYAALRRRGALIALVLGGGASLVFFAGAPLFARILHDPELVEPIRYVAPISAIYGLYAVNVGTLNATRRFKWQAMLDMFMAASKAVLIIVFAAMGLGLAMTLGGFTLASGMAFALSLVLVWRFRPRIANPAPEAPAMAGFAGILILFTLATNLLLLTDLAVLKRYAVSDAQQDAVGFYSSAQLVALVPYSLLNAVSLVMFPLIATLSASQDREKIRRYVAETAKVTVLLLAMMAAVAASAASEVQALLFPDAYGSAAADLRLMVWGYSGYSLAITVAWIFNSSSRSRIAIALVTLVLVIVTGLALRWVPGEGDLGAARAVAVAGAVGALAALAALRAKFSAGLPLLFAIKIGVAVAAVTAIGYAWTPAGKVLILGKLLLLTVTFIGIVLASKAVTIREIKDLRRAG